MSRLTFRSMFLSDVHLGSKDAHAEYLLDLLHHSEAQHIYLVGDIFDLWKLRSGWHWTQTNNRIVQTLLARALNGTRVVYIPGNHDELARDYIGMRFSGVDIARQAIHTTADGRRMLITHGDELDMLVTVNHWLRYIGDLNYSALLAMNRAYNRARRSLGLPYWSLCSYLKSRLGNAVAYVRRFEEAAVERARQLELDGVICGHIHVPRIEWINGLLYANSGDWVENCTALVEEANGHIGLLHWARDSMYLIPQEEAAPVAARTPS